ncbi:Crp/Fnr family transcriptional regulator [Pseudanabaena sp. PCC 6802]|uniref:Crp/Fnr family transcriptional regulator n=1 Tax=Pseudanabaena sp. PCC 6802 TaxID=118173 RepID=UPI00034D72DD|nr:Crp/Fnr family transcriptional regulator [Pseudanabaena sp. PCC 6802]
MAIASLLPVEVSESTYYKFERRSLLPQDSDFFWHIESGVVRTLTWQEDGTVIGLGLWSDGDIVGSALSSMNPYEMECLTNVKARILPRSEWHRVTEIMIQHIKRSEQFLKILRCKVTESSLLQLLNWLANRFGREIEAGQLIDLRLTHQDIAELIGTTRVTVTRTLNQLERQGIISRQAHQLIVLPDRQPFWHYEI